MTTRENAESIVQSLDDMACDGDVAEVMVFVRDASGRLQCAYAADDMRQFVDDAQAALAQIDTETDAQQKRWLH